MDFGVENPLKINQQSIQKAIENKMQVGMDSGWLLERFGIDFGSKLGGKLGPSWHQNLKNGGPKTMSKKDLKKMSASRASHEGNEGVGPYKYISPHCRTVMGP